jgi:hypothetical protein
MKAGCWSGVLVGPPRPIQPAPGAQRKRVNSREAQRGWACAPMRPTAGPPLYKRANACLVRGHDGHPVDIGAEFAFPHAARTPAPVPTLCNKGRNYHDKSAA